MTGLSLEGLTTKQVIDWYRNASPEDLDKERIYVPLERFMAIAETFYNGNVNKFFFLQLGFNLWRKKNRKILAESQLEAASAYIKEIKSKGYSDLPDFKKLIDRYNALSKKLGMQ